MAKETKLNALKFGVAGGILGAICVLATSIIAGIGFAPTWVLLITEIYGTFGYATTIGGTILGMIYGFVDLFIMTWIFAFVYNKLL